MLIRSSPHVVIRDSDVCGTDAQTLLGELNAALTALTRSSGACRFCKEDVMGPRGAFMIVYVEGEPYACGGLRPRSHLTAEIKRVYARRNHLHLGNRLLRALERRAARLGYKRLVLETRRINGHAVSFYRQNGYRPCAPYGSYVGRPEAICLEKRL